MYVNCTEHAFPLFKWSQSLVKNASMIVKTIEKAKNEQPIDQSIPICSGLPAKASSDLGLADVTPS
jgi:hypothetical protein